MLQFSLPLFGVALAIYLWDLNVSAAKVVLAVPSIGLAFYTCTTVAATIWSDFPFQTSSSVLLPKLLSWVNSFAQLSWVWLRRRLKRRAIALLLWIGRATEDGYQASSLGHVLRKFLGGTNAQNNAGEDPRNDYPMTLSNPAFWRPDPLQISSVTPDARGSRLSQETVQRCDRNRAYRPPAFVPQDDGNTVGGKILASLL